MKALMLPIIAFVVFFAIGGGAGAYLSKPAAADSTQADSTHADSTHADSSKADAAHGDAPKADTAHGAKPDTSHGAATPAPTPANAQAHGAAGATPAVSRDPNSIAAMVSAQTRGTVAINRDGSVGDRPDSLPDYARMASLLSKMGAREAARTVEQLDAKAAAHALAAMSDKQAALVLAQLAPEKAAALLQTTLTLIPRTAAP